MPHGLSGAISPGTVPVPELIVTLSLAARYGRSPLREALRKRGLKIKRYPCWPSEDEYAGRRFEEDGNIASTTHEGVIEERERSSSREKESQRQTLTMIAGILGIALSGRISLVHSQTLEEARH